jgi:2-oxoglutarate dehydrogenase E2 component (dihydrolipoamide succinyltransferase)
MATVELIMPKLGESIMEATILKWLKQPGDMVSQDESVLEVATDKVDTEVPCMYAGKIVKLLAKEGEVVQVGKAIAIIEATGITEAPRVLVPETAPAPASPVLHTATYTEKRQTSVPPAYKTGNRFYSPLVKRIAREEKISITELDKVPGSGAGGRVTRRDLLAFIQQRQVPGTSGPLVPAVINPEDEIIEMDRMRQLIAERMLDSRKVSPHVTSFVEADVTDVVKWRENQKEAFRKKFGQSLTFTPIFVEAVARAIQDFPMINIQVDRNRIIRKKSINIGVAVALPSGNLIVPVIKNADQLSLDDLSLAVNDLANRARENKLKPDDLSGGTFTISNVGSFGNLMGTPIIMQPQVAILAIGAIQKKPAVVETPQGDTIAIRHKMFLSHSYDHRVVDGALGGSFVRRVADYLEKFLERHPG